MAISDYLTGGANPVNPLASQDTNKVVSDSLQSVLGGNSDLIKNARQRGMEVAAQRGGINSSIAAGSAERSAMETAVPIAQQAIAMKQTQDQATMDNWLSQQNFGRSLYATQFSNSNQMLASLTQASIDDPELYTPEVVSGYSNFFQKNMQNVMSQYFPELQF